MKTMTNIFAQIILLVWFFAGCSSPESPTSSDQNIAAPNPGRTYSPRLIIDPAPPPAPSTITVSASKSFIWPPNKKMIPVVFSGTTGNPGTNVITYTLVDEYGKLNTSGTLSATPNYSFPLNLQAARKGKDKDGRTYTVTVQLGTASATATVVVPHDMGKDDDDDDHGDDDHDGNEHGN